MGSLATLFGFGKITTNSDDGLPNIFPFPMPKNDFVRIDVMNIYSKILTDVCERTHGLNEDQARLLWDNCLKSESSDGLISLLARAMFDKADLFLVYDSALKLVRKAKAEEERQIKSDYEKEASSKVGIFISFRNFVRSDMIKIYSALQFCTVGSLHKTMNAASALQLKISDLRASVSLTDAEAAKLQALAIAKGLGEGRDVLLDAKDSIESASPDMASTEQSASFIEKKLSFYLGLPASYITGEQTTGMGTTGESDTKAIERGLKNYFFSIVKPVLEALFQVTVTYKSQDFRQIAQGLEALKTFSLIDEELISKDDQKRVINILFDFDTEAGTDK